MGCVKLCHLAVIPQEDPGNRDYLKGLPGLLRTCQVVWVDVAVHPDVGPTGCQVPNDPPWARPKVLEGILCIDAALNRVTLHRTAPLKDR